MFIFLDQNSMQIPLNVCKIEKLIPSTKSYNKIHTILCLYYEVLIVNWKLYIYVKFCIVGIHRN